MLHFTSFEYKFRPRCKVEGMLGINRLLIKQGSSSSRLPICFPCMNKLTFQSRSIYFGLFSPVRSVERGHLDRSYAQPGGPMTMRRSDAPNPHRLLAHRHHHQPHLAQAYCACVTVYAPMHLCGHAHFPNQHQGAISKRLQSSSLRSSKCRRMDSCRM